MSKVESFEQDRIPNTEAIQMLRGKSFDYYANVVWYFYRYDFFMCIFLDVRPNVKCEVRGI